MYKLQSSPDPARTVVRDPYRSKMMSPRLPSMWVAEMGLLHHIHWWDGAAPFLVIHVPHTQPLIRHNLCERSVQKKRIGSHELSVQEWDGVRTCSQFNQVLVSNEDTHRHVVEFLASTSITQTKRCYQTTLSERSARFCFDFNDFLMPFHSWEMSSFWGRNQLCPFSKWRVFLITKSVLFICKF